MESIGFTCKNFFFFIANFHVLGLFIPKKRVSSEKKMSVCHAALPALPALPAVADRNLRRS
jgi:hypothetical protein